MQRGVYHYFNIVSTRVRMEVVIYHCLVVLPHPFICGHRDNHFRTRRIKYILGINFRQNPTTLKFYNGPFNIIRNNEENEPNNVSIVSIVPGETWTLSNRC